MSDAGFIEGDAPFRARPLRAHPLRNWRTPFATSASMAVAVGLVSIVDSQPGPLILAAVLAMTLSRNRLSATWRGRAEAVVLLPVVALATAGVGELFLLLPVVAAVAYVLAMFLSIWFRRFGAVWTRVGSLIALPFVTLLIAPGAGIGTTPLGVVVLVVVVLVVVVVVRVVAEAVGFLPMPIPKPISFPIPKPVQRPALPDATTPSAARERPASSLHPVASTRMAIQMAVALTAAFAIGFLGFPQHFTWVVLTAFIVCSGNRGRADVLYKSGLRVAGAAVGTAIATVLLLIDPVVAAGSAPGGRLSAGVAAAKSLPGLAVLQGPLLVVVLLVIVAIGLWLREWTYAAWAVVMTLVITLLQAAATQPNAAALAGAGSAATATSRIASGVGGEPETLWIRILAIVVGALCGVAASWFVLPVRSESVVRRRLATALAALSEFARSPSPATDDELQDCLDSLDEVAKPWAVWERLTRRRTSTRQPGRWMSAVHDCARLVRARPELTKQARAALGAARRSIRDPAAIGVALDELRDALRRE